MYRNRSVKTKFIIWAVLTVSIVVLVGAVCFISIREMNLEQQRISIQYRNSITAAQMASLLDERIQISADLEDAAEGALFRQTAFVDDLAGFVNRLEKVGAHTESDNIVTDIEQVYERLVSSQSQDDAMAEVLLLKELCWRLVDIGEKPSGLAEPWEQKVAEIKTRIAITAVLGLCAIVFAGIAFYADVTRLLKRTREIIRRMAANLGKEGTLVSGQKEVEVCLREFEDLAEAYALYMETLETLADDNRAVLPAFSAQDTFGQLITKFSNSREKAKNEIINASAGVAKRIDAVDTGLKTLHESTKNQFAEIKKFANVLESASNCTKSHSKTTKDALTVIQKLYIKVEECARAMDDIQMVMGSINEGAESVSDIVKVIEDISFRTKILSINAAIEAVHAGDKGKGFSVVAGEVGNLAAKSAEALNEISMLIESGLKRTARGNQAVQDTNGMVRGIREYIQQYDDAFSEMAHCPVHDGTVLGTVSDGFNELKKTADTSAIHAEKVSEQAALLNKQISEFLEAVNA